MLKFMLEVSLVVGDQTTVPGATVIGLGADRCTFVAPVGLEVGSLVSVSFVADGARDCVALGWLGRGVEDGEYVVRFSQVNDALEATLRQIEAASQDAASRSAPVLLQGTIHVG